MLQKAKRSRSSLNAKPKTKKKPLLPVVLFGCAGLVAMFTLGTKLSDAMLKPPSPTVTAAPPPKSDIDPATSLHRLIDADNWNEMTKRLETRAKKFQGEMGIYFEDLKTGQKWTYNADALFPSASLVKIPIMASLYSQMAKGELTKTEKLVLSKADKLGGSGSLHRNKNGTRYSVQNLIYKMITESDNTACNLLLKRADISSLATAFKEELGLRRTNITASGMSLLNTLPEGVEENYTTPSEMAMLLKRLYNGTLISKAASREMVNIMRKTHRTTRFGKTLPRNGQWDLANKTGMLRLSCHDAGIFYGPKGDYILVVLTKEVPDYKYTANYIGNVAKITHIYYDKKPLIINNGETSPSKKV